MRRVFLRVLDELELAFRRLEAQVPPPVKVRHSDGFVLRYKEKTPQQALLQKFARQISGLHAIDLLLLKGFAQEQGVIQRTLDDIAEDILFITLGLSTRQWTKHHVQYLDDFWLEEPLGSPPKRGMVKRSTIRAFVNRASGISDPSSADINGRDIHKAYSGYVHAASINIVDMCVGDPPRYELAGITGSPLYADHVEDAWNYFYRGLISAVVMAKAFEDSELWHQQFSSLKGFESAFRSKVLPQ